MIKKLYTNLDRCGKRRCRWILFPPSWIKYEVCNFLHHFLHQQVPLSNKFPWSVSHAAHTSTWADASALVLLFNTAASRFKILPLRVHKLTGVTGFMHGWEEICTVLRFDFKKCTSYTKCILLDTCATTVKKWIMCSSMWWCIGVCLCSLFFDASNVSRVIPVEYTLIAG